MIIVLHSSAQSINRSYTNLYNQLQKMNRPDVHVIDVSRHSLDDIKTYISKASLIVFDNFIKVASDLNPTGLSSVMLKNWKGINFYQSIWDYVFNSRALLFYIASGWDLHWPGPDLTSILGRIDFLAWLYEKKPVSPRDVPKRFFDSWMNEQSDPISTWNTVKKHVPARMELMHSIESDEFCRDISSRKFWAAAVCGEPYKPRRLAMASARACNHSLAPYRFLDDRLLHASRRISIVVGNNLGAELRNRSRQLNQYLMLSRSTYSYVCGSGYLYPVRKFFEVPALGSLMFALPCTGMEDYGFENGVSFISCDPDCFGNEINFINSKEYLKHNIIKSAYELIREKHTSKVRAKQLMLCVDKMISGTFRGASFEGGDFVFS